MPSVNTLEPSPITPRADHPGLKAHRPLPRKRDILPTQESTSIPPSSSPRPDVTPPSNGYAYPTAPALPLTPPGLGLGACEKSSNVISRELSHELIPGTTGTGTPTHQLSPPTPDITPPRAFSQFKKREGLTPIHPSMSSRAESFTTAREALSSEEEELERRNVPATPLLRPAKHKLPHPLRTNTSSWEPEISKNAGPLGDGVVAEGMNVSQTDAATFDSFDGQRAKPQEIVTTKFQTRKHKRRPILGEHDPFSQVSSSPSDLHHISKSSSSRERSLKQRVQDSQNTPHTSSVEGFAEDIGWTAEQEQPDMSERIHIWRLSGISTTSTVEAIVIDSPPRKLPTLRHTKKKVSLRSASSPLPKSHFDNSTSSLADSHPRLLRRSARITNENRWSVSSDMSFAASATSTRPKPKHDVVPVVVIPQRRSSLKSTHSGSKDHSRTHSLGSSCRPATAPDNSIGSFDIARRTRRTLSASLPSTTSKNVGCGSYSSGPVIPQRKSSLSAPTSRNNSRAPSLTLESLRHALPPTSQPSAPERRNHSAMDYGAMDLVSIKIPAQEPAKQFANLTPHTSQQPCDENGPMISPSLTLTPFQASIQSLSPGPVEIHEARAVPFFFHNNKSLLLVDQQPITESRAVQELRTSPGDMEMKVVRPTTPDTSNQDTIADVDSPLRNPRPPPKPPAVKVIPPTPMDEINQPAVPETINSEKFNGGMRRLGSVRRALSSRRRAETYTAPVLSQNVRNPKAGKHIDSKLHPFWLPRPFWEGLVDSDIDGEGITRPDSPSTRNIDDLYVSNSLGIPHKRVVFAGPLSVLRRMSNRSRHRTTHRKSGNQEFPSFYNTGFPPLRVRPTRRNRNFRPRMVLQVPIRSLRELQQRILQIRRQREQDKLEERRDKLRKSIGGRILTNNTAIIFPDGR
ncbi:conserved hypothetical protein [Histoplasma capsulatum H143]|uniref:Uncharacterized protein n=1 Tax=Ajellomyces capsulatus (strain H143) TaxID=544712 RepID=C6H9N8_AJECH|nr:conserved hypothetical protein [Histoplasma capsulatum H143]